jgi:hypothetical protein
MSNLEIGNWGLIRLIRVIGHWVNLIFYLPGRENIKHKRIGASNLLLGASRIVLKGNINLNGRSVHS